MQLRATFDNNPGLSENEGECQTDPPRLCSCVAETTQGCAPTSVAVAITIATLLGLINCCGGGDRGAGIVVVVVGGVVTHPHVVGSNLGRPTCLWVGTRKNVSNFHTTHTHST